MDLKDIDLKFQTTGILTDEELKRLHAAYKQLADNSSFLGAGFSFFKKEIRLALEQLSQYIENRKS